jgi:hypothetical protein
MAATTLSKPGTKFGPCRGRCEHSDCTATRAQARQKCVYCGRRIGYDTRHYSEPCGNVSHALCAEEAAAAI